MPRTVDPDNYPLEYREMVEKAALSGKVFRIPGSGPMPDEKGYTGLQRLVKLRQHFYAFIGAVKRSEDEKWKDVKAWASQTMVVTDKNEVCLYISNRDKAWQAEMFREAKV